MPTCSAFRSATLMLVENTLLMTEQSAARREVSCAGSAASKKETGWQMRRSKTRERSRCRRLVLICGTTGEAAGRWWKGQGGVRGRVRCAPTLCLCARQHQQQAAATNHTGKSVCTFQLRALATAAAAAALQWGPGDLPSSAILPPLPTHQPPTHQRKQAATDGCEEGIACCCGRQQCQVAFKHA